MTLKELMQLCWNAGVRDAVNDPSPGGGGFRSWWEKDGEERHEEMVQSYMKDGERVLDDPEGS